VHLFRRAISIYEKTLAPNHPAVMTCRRNYDRCINNSLS
jgi:hypothetical protein